MVRTRCAAKLHSDLHPKRSLLSKFYGSHVPPMVSHYEKTNGFLCAALFETRSSTAVCADVLFQKKVGAQEMSKKGHTKMLRVPTCIALIRTGQMSVRRALRGPWRSESMLRDASTQKRTSGGPRGTRRECVRSSALCEGARKTVVCPFFGNFWVLFF